ncbi:PAS domain S-box protein [Cyclobacterium sp. SYSU L10401]|uniref:PAS domain S-box protein n=1 Tax=Cyclobacterium sp. SYSU L10401 TaxID=2678657 RepID=UPI0013D1A46A|nr:PAS domain S-box protein [Cyclobacterium sp. SYSU L10401]
MEGNEGFISLGELESYQILDTLPEKEFDDIVGLASLICQAPVSLITFLTTEKQFFKAHRGLDLQETPIDQSFCLQAVNSKEDIFIVRDARKDPRFRDNPLVLGGPGIVFYAGVPLHASNGQAFGALCVIDTQAREINDSQKSSLKALADQVIKLLDLRKKQLQLEEAKDSLQEEKNRLNNIIEATRVGTFEWNIETSEVRINSRWAEIVGYTLEELQPVNMDTWYKLVHPDDVAHSDAALKDCFDRKTEYYDIELRMIHKKGHEVWINDRGRVVKWSVEGKPLLMSGTHTDITDRKLAERELDDTLVSLKERIKEQQCLHQITQLRNSGYDVNTFLEKAVEILPSGWRFPQLAAARIQHGQENFSTPDFNPSRWIQTASCSTEEGKTLKITVAYQDNAPDLQDNPFYKEEYQLLEIVIQNICIYIDQKVSRNQLQSSNEKIQDLISTIDGIVWESDYQHFKLTYVSPKATAILGYSPEDWKSEANFWENHLHPEDKDRVIEFTKREIKKGRNHNIEYRMFAADGSEVWFNDMVTINKKDGETFLRGLMVDVTKRKLAEKELQLSEQRFRSLVQNGSDLIAILDVEGNYRYVSPTSTNILGVSPQDFIDKNAFDFIHPEDKDTIISYFSALESSFRIAIPPFRFKHLDGSWRWIETVATNMMDDPSIQGVVANSRDVTEKIVSDKKLALSEKRFRAMVQEGADLTAILNLDGEYLYVSPNFPQIVGFSEEELIGKRASEFFHPDDLEKTESEFRNIAHQKRIKSSPYRYRVKGGGWCWLQSVATNLVEDEAVKGVVINSIDITHLIATQEKLKTSEARYRGFYESQTNFVIRTDLEGNYTYVNKKFIADFGWIYPDGKIIGKSCMPSICEHDQERVIAIVEKCLALPEKVFKIEIDKPKQGGGTVTTLWDFICMVDGHGNPQEIQCMGIDISERIEFERELKKNNERYEYVNRATKDAIYEWDVVADEFQWGEGFYRIFGFEKGEQVRKISDWPKFMHPIDSANHQRDWDNFLSDSDQNRWHKDFRFRHRRGGYLYTEEIGHLIRDESGKPVRMIGVLRDVSEVKKASLLREMEYEVSSFFKNEINLNETLSGVLAYLSRYGGYSGGEIWMVGIKGKRINLVQSHWQNDKLAQIAGNTGSFAYGSGLPGKIWQDGILQVFENLSDLSYFNRKKLITSGNLREAAGIPLFQKEEVVGVVLLFGEKQGGDNLIDSQVFHPLGAFLGAEIKRKQQEEEMMLLFESAPEILAITDPDGYFVKVNPAFCALLGYSSEELVSKPFTDFIHSEDLAKTKSEMPEMFSSERKTRNFVNRYRTKSGAVRWISWNSSEVFGEEGLVFSYGHDITEMVELQELLDNASQLSRVGSWEIDLINNKLFLSSTSREIYELPKDQFPTLEEAINFYRPDVREFLKETINETIQSGNPWDVQLPLITYAGNEKWVRSIGKAEYEDGKCRRLFGSFQDIHKQKTNEIELTKNNRLLEVISRVIGKFLLVGDWNQVLNEVLELTGKAISVDRVYFFQCHLHPVNEMPVISQTAEWSRKGIPSQLHNPDLQNMPLDDYPDIYQRLKNGETFAKNRKDLPSGKLKDILESQGIVSTLAAPVMIDNELNGLLGFDDCAKERSWSENELSFLQTIVSNLSSAIQRRKSQLALQQSFEEKNAILESIGEAFFALDKDWKIRYWNHRAEQLMGLNRASLLGEDLFGVFPDAKKFKFQRQYLHALATKSPVHIEEYFEPLNSWLEVNAYPSEDGLSVFVKDVTKEKMAFENVRQSNERFEKIAEATNDAIWDFDVENSRLFWGKGFSTLFGYDLDSLTPTLDLLVDFIHPDDREKVANKIQQFFKSETLTSWFEEYRFLMANGYYAFVMDRAVFIRNQEGRVSRVVGAMTDISYRKEYEESLQALNQQLEQHAKELEISNKELEQFAYVASHDLQEPLRMVSSFIGLLEKKYGDVLDEKAHQYINFAVGGARRMRQIILDLLEYSRVGKNDEGLKIIHLDEVLDEVCLLHRKIISEKKASITYQDLPALITYKSPMTQLFSNLIGNALRYSQEQVPPKIHISASSEKDTWLFAITDNGLGIDPQFHEKIFIIFQSLHNKEKYGGTGMGLAIVKKIIENLGGKIWVESEEGKGSTFYFTWPKVENDSVEKV